MSRVLDACQRRRLAPKNLTKTASVGTSGVKMDFGAALNLGVANGSYSVLCFMPESVALVSVLWAEP